MDIDDKIIFSAMCMGQVKNAYRFVIMNGPAVGSEFIVSATYTDGSLKVILGIKEIVDFKAYCTDSSVNSRTGEKKEGWALESIYPKGLEAYGEFKNGKFEDDWGMRQCTGAYMKVGAEAVFSALYLYPENNCHRFQLRKSYKETLWFNAQCTFKVIPEVHKTVNKIVYFDVVCLSSNVDEETGKKIQLWNLRSICPKGGFCACVTYKESIYAT